MSISTISLCPFPEAYKSGVYFIHPSSIALTSAPLAISNFAIMLCPFFEAYKSGVNF